MRQLGIILSGASDVLQVSASSKLEMLLSKYTHVFNEGEIGKITGIQASLNIKPDANKFYIKARKVPFALLSKVEEELNFLEREGVLEKVDSSEYATPIVHVLKANGKVRICGLHLKPKFGCG